MTIVDGGDGVLCGIARKWARDSFFLNWFVMSCFAAVSVFVFSGFAFYKLYWPTQVTYEKWRWKSNPKFPTPEKVRDEIVQSVKAMWCAAICPALSIWLYAQGEDAPITTYAYCGTTPQYGAGYNFLTFLLFWIGSDFWEWGYHYIGHKFACMWNWHRHHHVFFNPTPFAVIADEFADQFCRSLPLLLFPMVMPANMDILYGVFGVLFYGTGVYHHCGYELRWPNAHTGFFNTAYHHYLHHAISIKNKPYHCGFMFQIWDQIVGAIYHGECFCVQCQQAKGLRSREEWEKVVVPDYTKLIQPSFWLKVDFLAMITGTSGADKNEELMSKADKNEDLMSKEKVAKTATPLVRGAAKLASAASVSS